MSGRKLYPDFIIGSEFFWTNSGTLLYTSCFSGKYFYEANFSFLALSLLRSKPPPVCKSLRALLYSSALALSSSCSLICFLNASSALFWVYFLFYYSSTYFLSLASSKRCLSISAFLFLSSSLIYFYFLFFSESSCSLSETEMLISWEYTIFSSIKT